MAVQGFVRNRRHQFGRQTTLNTVVAATHAYPFKGVADPDLNWVDPEVDAGSIDITVSPHREAPNLTASLTDNSLRYNHLPLMLSGAFGGGETATGMGTAQTWAYEPASDGSDEPDLHSYEFGDDVVEDWFQFGDGLLESLEITAPEGLGPLTASMNWRFGSVFSSGSTDYPDSPSVPTSLTVPTNDAVVYLKDGQIAIASDPDDFGTSQVSDALHNFTLRISKEIDLKRWANGDQSFDIDAYGIGARTIELECTFSKTTDTVGLGSESDAWMSASAVNRFVEISFESLAVAETGTPDIPYSWVFSMPMRYYTRTEGESGGNTTITLMGRAFLDPDGSDTDFAGVFKSTVVNTLAAL
jgi:hypothetical protein